MYIIFFLNTKIYRYIYILYDQYKDSIATCLYRSAYRYRKQ